MGYQVEEKLQLFCISRKGKIKTNDLVKVKTNVGERVYHSHIATFVPKTSALEVPLEKAMAPHSSTLAWKIPWMEEPGRLQSTGSLRVRHD